MSYIDIKFSDKDCTKVYTPGCMDILGIIIGELCKIGKLKLQ